MSSETLYSPLNRETRCTRLLKFLPRRDEGPIKCTLTTHSLNHPPPFIGISYVWGYPSPTYEISVNNTKLRVRENLWQALQQLSKIAEDEDNCIVKQRNSRNKFPKYFWIDAISINQEDVSERGYQVDLMKDIFSTASFVISWIGESDGNVPELFQYLHHLKRYSRQQRAEYLRRSKRRFTFKDAQWLVSRPYWSRIWIVQEFTLPRELYILCGSDAISWPTLEQFRPFGVSNKSNLGFKHMSKQENHHTIDKHVNSCRELSNLRRSWQTGSKQPSFTDGDPSFGARPTLARLLAFCKDYQCSDPRDRVYGLLGLTESEEGDRLSTDYTINPFQLYHRVIFHLKEHKRIVSHIFQSRLAEGLQITDHDDLPVSSFVYETVGSRDIRRFLASDSDVGRRQFLKDVKDYLGTESISTGDEPDSEAFGVVLEHFRCFPKEHDPATWATFEEALKKAFHFHKDRERHTNSDVQYSD